MADIRVRQATGHNAPGQTTGMLLEEAFAEPAVWIGQVRTPPGSVGGWHHHGRHETFTYLAEGRARFEWGATGRESADLSPGDFVHVPARLVHREINNGSIPNLLILFRTGTGPRIVTVEPP